MTIPLTAALDVGGTHVSAALVTGTDVASAPVRRDVDSGADADAILGAWLHAGAALGQPVAEWAVALPGPCDYAAGVGSFDGVGKFAALRGVPLRPPLLAGLPGARRVTFCNDADAFAVGEARAGVGRGAARLLCLTLGTGVGSAFLVDGLPTTGAGLPPGGDVHHLTWQGHPLEHWMSRRALLRAHRATGGSPDDDVVTIAALALDGNSAARTVFANALGALGQALAVPLQDFGADRIVVGGAIARSWPLIEDLLAPHVEPPVVAATHPDTSALVGAAALARSQPG